MLDLALIEDAPRPVGDIMAAATEKDWRTVDPENLLLMETGGGTITIELSGHLAAAHTDQMRRLAREGYYEGLSLYRVIEGFVAQGGDFSGTAELGSATVLQAEFEEPLPEGAVFTPLAVADGYAENVGFIDGHPAGREGDQVWLAHCTGAFAYGRNNGRDTASTEFYITLQPQRYLDRNLTVAGRVIDGMSVVQAAPRGVIDGDPETDDFQERLMIKSLRVAADLPEAERPVWQVMDDQSELFAELMEARKARPSEFFYYRPDHVNLCQMPVPVRQVSE